MIEPFVQDKGKKEKCKEVGNTGHDVFQEKSLLNKYKIDQRNNKGRM